MYVKIIHSLFNCNACVKVGMFTYYAKHSISTKDRLYKRIWNRSTEKKTTKKKKISLISAGKKHIAAFPIFLIKNYDKNC